MNDWQSVCTGWKRQTKPNNVQVYCLHLHSALELEKGTTPEGGVGGSHARPEVECTFPHTELKRF